jgi:hypothetical protein
MARADDTNSYFMGFGPKQSGTLQYEVSRATSLHPGQRIREIPVEVALGKPPAEKPKSDEPELKLTGGEKDE